MPSPEQERMDAISAALARIVQQQGKFEERLERVESVLRLAASPALVPPPVSTPPAVLPPPLPEIPPQSQGMETSIGLTLINRVGVVTLVLGIGFLFRLAIDNNLIGAAGRVELGILAGLLAIGGAELLWRRGQAIFSQGITAVGISILYLAIFSAFGFYHLVPQGLAFVGMALTTLLAGALALRYNSIAIAALGLFGGFLTPMMLSTGENHPWFLFGYVLLLDLGALALVKVKAWKLLESLSFAGTVLIYAGWFEHFHSQDRFTAAVWVVLFHGLFAAATSLQPIFLISQFLTAGALAFIWVGDPRTYFMLAVLVAVGGLAVADLRRHWKFAANVAFISFWIWSGIFAAGIETPKPTGALVLGLTCGFLLFLAWTPWWILVRRERARSQDLAMLALNGMAYFGASYYLLNPEHHSWMGLFAVALAGIHLALAYELWDQPTPALLAIGVALSLLTLAVPIQFTAWRITMAWSLEAAALIWIGARVANRRLTQAGTAIFVLVMCRLLLVDAWIYPTVNEYAALINARFLTFLIATVCLWLAARWVERPVELRLICYFSGHFLLLWTLTQEMLGWAGRSASPNNLISVETISISILYAVYAVALVSLGVGTRTAVNRIAGLGLIGVVVLKLYLFDVWQLSRVYRTLAFVALGVLLLSTSFLYSRFRALISRLYSDE